MLPILKLDSFASAIINTIIIPRIIAKKVTSMVINRPFIINIYLFSFIKFNTKAFLKPSSNNKLFK
jgi:hypothetical protein